MNVRLDPSPAEWLGSARSHAKRSGAEKVTVVSGHQAFAWHGGLVAKLFAALAAARACDGELVWIITDNDDTPSDVFSVPVHDRALGRARKQVIAMSGEEEGCSPRGGAFEASAEIPAGLGLLLGDSAERIEGWVKALGQHEDAPSAGHQVTRALFDFFEIDTSMVSMIGASEVARTDMFMAFSQSMHSDAQSMAAAYNEAVGEVPAAGVPPLVRHPTKGWELPLWTVDGTGARRRVFSGGPLPEVLLPRALSLTGFARLHMGHLFVHGTGGRVYDGATERWIERWLGERLAPMATATADVALPLPGDAPGGEEVARAHWLAHHAKHTPSVLDDDEGQSLKDALVERIRVAESFGERSALFAELHVLLGRMRALHAEKLARFDERARELARAFAEHALLRDRTWPMVLFGAEVVRSLRAEIDGSFGSDISVERVAGSSDVGRASTTRR